jgi:lipopolysaccharide transport system permease protein
MNFALLRHFVRQDLIERHAGSALGALWTLLLPLANILIFTLVFSRIMGARLQDMGMEYLGNYGYSVFLIVGLLAWNCFATTLTRTAQAYRDKANLITKVQMSLFALPLYIVVSEGILYLVSMAFFAVFLLLIDFQWSLHWLWLPVIFTIQQTLAYALGLLCAIFGVFLRDLLTMVGVVTQLWFWLTPVVYVATILPEKWALIFHWNPAHHCIQALRDALILGHTPNLPALGAVFALGLALLLAAWQLGLRLEKDIRDFL